MRGLIVRHLKCLVDVTSLTKVRPTNSFKFPLTDLPFRLVTLRSHLLEVTPECELIIDCCSIAASYWVYSKHWVEYLH